MSLGQVNLSQENVAAIQEGMLAVTQTGSLAAAFQDLPFQAGAKTGSAQVTGEENANAVLVCFAPTTTPDRPGHRGRAGGSGSALGTVAVQTLSAWAGKAGL